MLITRSFILLFGYAKVLLVYIDKNELFFLFLLLLFISFFVSCVLKNSKCSENIVHCETEILSSILKCKKKKKSNSPCLDSGVIYFLYFREEKR